MKTKMIKVFAKTFLKMFPVSVLAVIMLLFAYGCDDSGYEEVEVLTDRLADFDMKNVTLLDSYEINAFKLEADYLRSLDADRLLKGFCERAGVELDAEKYGGWETSAIQGHTLGHYMTAVAQAYAASGDEKFRKITDYIVGVLSECQDDSGYLAAIPESHYDQIEKGNTSGTWVPWYSLHKILAGLISVYEFTGNSEALKIAGRLGDWVYRHTSAWTAEVQTAVLNVEYGGMNDALYELYKYTKSEKHLSAAHSFDEMTLFEPLYKGEDILNGKHANTTIPKIIGALNRYSVTGEEYYLQVAANFWKIVIENHTYITGGNSEWEHFGEPGILDAERTNCNCETCNTYNMLKLSRELFKITGDTKYSDYYENTFINAILSSQNPETGMTTYFQPMATGFFKVYSSPDKHFWCCTGSGMENFSKLPDSIYFHNSDSIFVNRYTSSKVVWQEKGLTITQQSELPFVKFTINGFASAKIVLRIPDWTSKPSLRINGESFDYNAVNNLIILEKEWHDGDVVEYNMPMHIEVHKLPDNNNAVAFRYGPWVLSADMGDNEMNTSTTGVDVTIPLWDPSLSDTLVIENDTIGNWLNNINDNLVRNDDFLQFTLKGTNPVLTFSPHYMQHKKRYGIYFHLADKNTVIKQNEADKYIIIDSLPVGNDQYEFSHGLKAENSTAGNFKGVMFRDAAPYGYFSYDLAVDSSACNLLAVKYYSGDAGRSFSIYVDDILLEDVVLDEINPNGFYDKYYEIPIEMSEGKDKITVKFKANETSYAGGIFDKLSTVKLK